MKKGLVIIVFLTLSLVGFAQEKNNVVTSNTELIETVLAEAPEADKVSISAKSRAKVLKLNRKKNNEIISINAYRKSLQIKVKTKRLC